MNTKKSLLINWAKTHKTAFNNAFQRLTQAPITTLITVLVVGVALSLPSAFQVLIKNLEYGQQSINEQARISLYLTHNASSVDIENLLSEIKVDASIRDAIYISADQGLKDFQKQSTLGNTLTLLDNNPLPAVIQVFPDTRKLDPTQIEALSKEFETFALVDKAQIDVLWLKRLHSITQLIKHATLAISIFLIFTVLVIIGNTIKLIGQDFHDEIIVSKLVGATDGYVRRPFLYSGALYGAFGSIIAITFVGLGTLWLSPQINHISQLYQSQIPLYGLSFNDMLSIIGTGVILGLGGAWIAANRLIHSLSI
jgi:cell division transport system permease protein